MYRLRCVWGNLNTVLPILSYWILWLFLKFVYSEKATKFCEIFSLLLTTVHTVKSKGKISQNSGVPGWIGGHNLLFPVLASLKMIYIFQHYRTLKFHIMRMHQKDKPFKCKECDNSYINKSELDMHFKYRHSKDIDIKLVF